MSFFAALLLSESIIVDSVQKVYILHCLQHFYAVTKSLKCFFSWKFRSGPLLGVRMGKYGPLERAQLANKYYLLTESEVITGKSQTESLMY